MAQPQKLVIMPPPVERRGPGRNRAYLVLGLDGLWHAKRSGDGLLLAAREHRYEARDAAEQLGYSFSL